MKTKHLRLFVLMAVVVVVCNSQLIAQSIFDYADFRIALEQDQEEAWRLDCQHKGTSLNLLDNNHIESSGQMNYNPTFSITDLDAMVSFQLDSAKGITVFTVFKSAGTSAEKAIWSLSVADTIHTILTDKRTADIRDWKFFNHNIGTKDSYMATFFKNDLKNEDASVLFELGNEESTADFPLVQFNDEVAELIMFNFPLSALLINQIESSLSLKYGLTLVEKNYINSANQIVWDTEIHPEYATRLTGIGRDDKLNLFQKQSSNAECDLDLVISKGVVKKSNSENQSELTNMDYLIWGDNGASAELEQRGESETYRLKRNWLIARAGNSHNYTIQVDKGKIGGLTESEFIYLLVGSSEDESYLDIGTHVLANVVNEDLLEFDFAFDSDSSGTDLFSIVTGGPIIPKIAVSQPLCEPQTSGTLHVGAEGPNAPFSFELSNLTLASASFQFSLEDNRIEELQVEPGDYELTISDSRGNSVTEHFFVQAADAPIIDLEDEYILSSSAITLSLGFDDVAYHYEWRANGISISSALDFTLTEIGSHECYVDLNGCVAKHDFEVTNLHPDNPIELSVLPNPSIGGHFTIVVRQQNSESLTLSIADNTGRVIKTIALGDSDFYRLEENLLDAGIYIVSVQSSEYSESKKLIVTR